MREAWRDEALCLQFPTEFWFPEDGVGSLNTARRICAQCPVIAPCLEFGMSMEDGMYGGKSRDERMALRRKGKAA